MRTNTAPISREALLAEANNIIRQHEDYLHGMIATDVEQKSGVLVFRGEYFWMRMDCPPPKPPRYLICLNIWPICFRKNTTGRLRKKRGTAPLIHAIATVTAAAFHHAATSATASDRRFPPRCR